MSVLFCILYRALKLDIRCQLSTEGLFNTLTAMRRTILLFTGLFSLQSINLYKTIGISSVDNRCTTFRFSSVHN